MGRLDVGCCFSPGLLGPHLIRVHVLGRMISLIAGGSLLCVDRAGYGWGYPFWLFLFLVISLRIFCISGLHFYQLPIGWEGAGAFFPVWGMYDG